MRLQASGTGRRCVFREQHSVDHFTQFQSVVDQRWLVGFSRRGRRLTAATSRRDGRQRRRRRRRRRCFQFVKTLVHDSSPGPPTISYERLYSVLHHPGTHVTSGGDPTWPVISDVVRVDLVGVQVQFQRIRGVLRVWVRVVKNESGSRSTRDNITACNSPTSVVLVFPGSSESYWYLSRTVSVQLHFAELSP